MQTVTHTQSNTILKEILEELRSLRMEISLLIPQDDLEDYAHPERIKRSYEKVLKEHPLQFS